MPVDGAVGIDVFGNDLILGVDKAFESERVSSTTAGEDIVYRSKRSRFVCENLRRAILGRHHLSGIRPAEQDVVAVSPIHPVSAKTADQKILAGAARQLVVTRATPDLVVAAATAEHVVASHAGDSIGAPSRRTGHCRSSYRSYDHDRRCRQSTQRKSPRIGYCAAVYPSY